MQGGYFYTVETHDFRVFLWSLLPWIVEFRPGWLVSKTQQSLLCSPLPCYVHDTGCRYYVEAPGTEEGTHVAKYADQHPAGMQCSEPDALPGVTKPLQWRPELGGEQLRAQGKKHNLQLKSTRKLTLNIATFILT